MSKNNGNNGTGVTEPSQNEGSRRIIYDDKFQKENWKNLSKSINKLIHDFWIFNVKTTIFRLWKLNIVRGRGLLVRSIMKKQLQKPKETYLYSALISKINSHIPKIGKLIINRLVLQFKSGYITNNYKLCLSSVTFIGYLTLNEVVSHVLVLQIIQLLLEKPTNSSINLSIELLKITGEFLIENSNAATVMILNRYRDLLQEDENLDNKTKTAIKNILRQGQSNFRSNPPDIINIVDNWDKETHLIDISADLKSRDYLNLYTFDEKFKIHEKEYKELRRDILEEENDDTTTSGSDSDSSDSDSDSSESEEKNQIIQSKPQHDEENQILRSEPEPVPESVPEPVVSDLSQSELLKFQKEVYLTIMSSMSSDEAVFKLLKLKFKESNLNSEDSKILSDMIIKCCSQEKTYSKYYGIIGEKLCFKNRKWENNFIELFKDYYNKIENFETNQLRNLGKFFGHLFSCKALNLGNSWNEIKITEQDTNPVKRILLKFIFQEMVEEMSINDLKKMVLLDKNLKPFINGVFPVVNIKLEDIENVRFSINFFTAIGLGVLTEEMRDVLTGLEEMLDRGRSRSGSSSRSRSGSSYSRSNSRSYSRSRSGSRQSFSRSPSEERGRERETKTAKFNESRTPSRTPSREPLKRARSNSEDSRSKLTKILNSLN
ncbi:CWC22 [Candida pseudojiufengensis]|uniref:CWC22 n=1 Tax=Candida pseudojiufengensis TaxID=497109 RepID=UPI002223FC91|nr:CWC22 [Candida pseudojiufengensis]KAI5960112.1 CWC22 [Candida pseudojiufengensis]